MIQQLKEDNQVILGQIYRQYRSDFIGWMISKYGCSRDVAREVYQNTMLTVSIKAKNGELDTLESTLKTYIYGIAKNKYKEYVRSNSRYAPIEEGTLEKLSEPEPDRADPEDIELVRKCLIKLGEPCKSVLELYYFHDMSMQDIKEHLVYKNSNTVKNMKYKCLLRLREIFQQESVRKNSI